MFITVFAVLVASPAPIEEIQYRSHDVATALMRGCKVQRVSVAGGKAEHAPIIRCPVEEASTDGDATRRAAERRGRLPG